ncbi:4'-phosphopantetheinyl transferase superfamily protein [Microbulbifer agarilyticus]|uniref:4'-phosphopantetheinyl transferase family protein n=1 Tax=Microbulbifer agarilyticus TaxID=260552 RepID=UPI001C93D16B|nr:4'-phosphopantetheinyl transferase superfamily protein [Microbulbifer agarilyticus]MBY6192033.1 4'-phosphopantetheinyl transferase superfamily protein [Microbulbifer agarilyticus]
MSLPAVWILHRDDIAPGSEHAKALNSLLSKEEHARQLRYASDQARHGFLLSRGLLRSVLGKISGHSPESLDFSISDSGKPALAVTPELHFSLSHSGQWIALSVSCEAPVGIDIEQPQKPRDFLRIAHHYFHPDECALLDNAPPELLPVHFYRLWTMKEAFFKARGTGISEGLGRINLAGFHLGEGIHLDAAMADSEAPWQFNYLMLPLPDGNHLHMALAGQDPVLGEISAEQITRGLPD